MGMIQGNINQLLGMSAIIAKFDPGSERRAQIRQLNEKEKILKSKRDAAVSSIKEHRYDTEYFDEKFGADISLAEELAGESIGLRKEQFNLNPTQESYENLQKASKAKQNVSEIHKEFSARKEAARRADEDRQAAEELRQQELSKVRESLLANTPEPKWGVRKNGNN